MKGKNTVSWSAINLHAELANLIRQKALEEGKSITQYVADHLKI